MIIVVVGETAVGKDYIVNNVVIPYLSTKDIKISKVVTDTTRPVREGEITGKTYNFLSKEEFIKNIDNNEYLEYQVYNTVNGKWYYGTRKESITDNSIIILDKYGFINLKEIYPNVKCMYLNAFDESERFYRALDRLGNKVTNKDVRELWRRIETDRNKFKDIHDYDVEPIPQFYDSKTEDIVKEVLDKWIQEETI